MEIPTLRAGGKVDALLEVLADQGVVVLKGVLEGPVLRTVRDECERVLEPAPLGDNPFDGYRTRRVFDPLRRTRILDGLVLHPAVHAAVSGALSWPYQFGMTILSEICPGENPQRAHRDAAVYPLPKDFPEVMVNTIWALDDFTPQNGATVVAPGSHKNRELRDFVPATMDAGSVMIYSGRLLHGAGGNTTSDATRLGLIVEHVARWLRPAECHPLAIGTDIAASVPKELQELLGFNQTNEYFGFINGKPPAHWLACRET